MFKRFRRWLVEHAAQQAVLSVLAHHGTDRPAGRMGIQFVLPDGRGIEVDNDLVHARAFREAAVADHVDARLIDVLRAGIVRAAHPARYQVCSDITSAQAQFMFDSAKAVRDAVLTVSIADAAMAERDADRNQGIGPIEIDDTEYENFDLDRAKPATIRNWVNAHVN